MPKKAALSKISPCLILSFVTFWRNSSAQLFLVPHVPS